MIESATASKPVAMRDAFLTELLSAMRQEQDIYFVTADFGSPVLDHIRSEFPDRFVNVGVAEQNLINVSAGLALEGFKVFTYAIAPFITMRCFEQLRVNLALLSEVREMNVNLIGVGAGYSYVVSGPTHQCYEDITLIRSLPNFQLFSASDHCSAASFLPICLEKSGPKYLRFDAQVLPKLRNHNSLSVSQKGFEILASGRDAVVVSTGYVTHTALDVIEEIRPEFDVKLLDLLSLTGFNKDEVIKELSNAPIVFTFEEGFVGRGGLDALIGGLLQKELPNSALHAVGVRPGYSFELGTRQELHELVGIGKNSFKSKLLQALRK